MDPKRFLGFPILWIVRMLLSFKKCIKLDGLKKFHVVIVVKPLCIGSQWERAVVAPNWPMAAFDWRHVQSWKENDVGWRGSIPLEEPFASTSFTATVVGNLRLSLSSSSLNRWSASNLQFSKPPSPSSADQQTTKSKWWVFVKFLKLWFLPVAWRQRATPIVC